MSKPSKPAVISKPSINNSEDSENENGRNTNTKNGKKSPFGQLLDAVYAECQKLGIWSEDLHRDLPKKWEKHGDLVILPENCFLMPAWRMLGKLIANFLIV